MGIVSNQYSCSGKLSLLLVALAVVMGFQPGLAEDREIEQLRKAAGQGDAGAQLHMGLRYYTGAGVTQDSKEAVEWLRKSGGQGNTLAQYELSQIWSSDESVPLDREEGLRWLHKAAEGGHAEAQSELGDKYRIRSLTQCEEESRETAKVMLKWYRKAAEQGVADAQYWIARWFSIGGDGVPEDDREAVKWYRKAAEQGHAEAQSELSFMYERGWGVPKDYVNAYAWQIVAVGKSGGGEIGAEWLNRLKPSISTKQKAAGKKLAAELFKLIIKPITPKTLKIRLLHEAAEQGLASAQYRLGNEY